MITDVQDVYYNVSDMKRSILFYQNLLGMTVLNESEHWTSLKCGEVTIGLHWTDGQDVPAVPKDSHGAHCGATLTLRSTDVLSDLESLRSAGIIILGTSDNPWGKMIVFQDPDGNILKIMQPAEQPSP